MNASQVQAQARSDGLDSAVVRLAKEMRPSAWPWIIAGALVALTVALALFGLDFYGRDLADRVGHPDYEVLSPDGIVGQGYGVVGTALFVINLLYLVRRRLARLPLGSMRAWLNAHVITGLFGSALILFHSAFQLRTPIAMVTSASLGLVVVTGLMGRWLVAISPRPDPRGLAERLAGLEELVPGVALRVRRALAEDPPIQPPASASTFRVLATIPAWRRQIRHRRRVVSEAWREVTRPRALTAQELKVAGRIAKDAASLAAREVRAEAASRVLRSWRGVHRLFALLMVLCVSVHIGVAWFYGYRWLFSG